LSTESEYSATRIEHDHTQLDVLFEDLRAVSQQGLSASDEELLQDARTNWTFLQEEIARHFGKEERKLFAVLAEQYPALRESFDALAKQHQTIRRELVELGQMLKGPPEEVATRQESFDMRWQALEALWELHSNTEWELLQGISRPNVVADDVAEPGGEE
jgi:iron-sulfur cluster repair protein YtfE (RIC family)